MRGKKGGEDEDEDEEVNEKKRAMMRARSGTHKTPEKEVRASIRGKGEGVRVLKLTDRCILSAALSVPHAMACDACGTDSWIHTWAACAGIMRSEA